MFFSELSDSSARVVLVCLDTKKEVPYFGTSFFGGDDQTRTDYLYVANVSLYRVSYIPITEIFYIIQHIVKIFNRFRRLSEKFFLFFLSRGQDNFSLLDS